MKSYAALAALAAFVAAAEAASLGNSNFNVNAGQVFTITWLDAVGTVKLDLRNGPSGNLKQLETITDGAPSDNGSGSFAWNVPQSFSGVGPYAIVITDSTGPNYSSQFEIQGAEVDEAAPTTTASSLSALGVPTVTSTTTTATDALVAEQTSSSYTFEFQSSSLPVYSSSVTFAQSSSTLTKTASTSTAKVTYVPSTIPSPPDGESKASGMASPLALVLVSIAAMFYMQ